MLQLDEPKMEVAAVMVGGKVDACAAEVAELHNATLLVHGKVKICTLSNTQNIILFFSRNWFSSKFA